MNIVLYSTHCPKCNVLAAKLDGLNIKYKIETNVDVMAEKGFMSAPMLEVDNEIMDFSKAIQWINNQEEVDI